MGNQQQSDGRRVFDDAYSFPQDSQDLADDIHEFALSRQGTSAQRQALAPGLSRAGLAWYETDSGITYVHDGSGWVPDSRLPYGINWRTANQAMADGSGSKQLTYDGTPVLRGGVLYASNGLTVPLSGVYEVNVVATYDVSNTGRRDAAFAVNGTIRETYRYIGVASASVPFLAATRAEVMLSAGDTVTAWGQQTSGATRQVTGLLSVKMVTG